MADPIKIVAELLRLLEAIVEILLKHLELSTGEKTKLKVRMHNLKESMHPLVGGDKDAES